MSELALAVRPDGSAYLMHHGVKGMKWGVRKRDERYSDSPFSKRRNTKIQKLTSRMMTNQMAMREAQSVGNTKAANKAWQKVNKDTARYMIATKDPAYKNVQRQRRKGLVIGIAAGGAIGGAIGQSVAMSTKKGQALSAEYARRYSEIQQHLSTHEKLLTQTHGKDAVDKALAKMMKKRPDIY